MNRLFTASLVLGMALAGSAMAADASSTAPVPPQKPGMGRMEGMMHGPRGEMRGEMREDMMKMHEKEEAFRKDCREKMIAAKDEAGRNAVMADCRAKGKAMRKEAFDQREKMIDQRESEMDKMRADMIAKHPEMKDKPLPPMPMRGPDGGKMPPKDASATSPAK